MPGNFKVTFFFEQIQQARIGASAALGWTETWYLGNQAGTIDAAFNHPDIQAYLNLRRAILTVSARIPFLRISDEANPRLVKIQSLQGILGQVSKFAQTSKDSQVQCAVLVDLMRLPRGVLEPVHHKRFLIRGLSSSLIDGNVLDTSSPVWGALTKFLDFIGLRPTGAQPTVNPAKDLGIRFHDPSAGYINVTNAALYGPSVTTIAVSPQIPGLDVVPHAQVELRDFKAPMERYNRTWNFIAYRAGTFNDMILGKTRKPLPTDSFPNPTVGVPRARQVKWLYGTVDQYALIGLRNRKTGRLFRQLRGRSSNRL